MINDLSEKFNQMIEHIIIKIENKKESQFKNTITEMKNISEGINSRSEEAED